MENLEITAVLIWLYTSGGAATVLSVLFERWPQFQALVSEQKEAVFTYSAIALSLVAYAIVTWVPADTLNSLAPVFNIVVGVVLSVLFGKVMHKADKK